MMEITTAKAIVRQFYRQAADPALENILELSKGSNYRAYYTAAFFIWTEYQQLVRADEVSFAYDKIYAIKGLLAIQAPIDIGLTDIPPGFTVDDLLALLPGIENVNVGSFMIGSMGSSGDSCGSITNAFLGMSKELPL